MKFEFIRNNETRFGIDEMCSALEVSRSGYYAWKEGRPSSRRLADRVAKEAIRAVFVQSKGRYGYRPIHSHLKEEGVDCGRDRTLRLMRELGLKGSQTSRFKPVGTDRDRKSTRLNSSHVA